MRVVGAAHIGSLHYGRRAEGGKSRMLGAGRVGRCGSENAELVEAVSLVRVVGAGARARIGSLFILQTPTKRNSY